MKVTLELWCDQSGAKIEDINSLSWELYVNEKPFPDKDNNLLHYEKINKIIHLLMDIEAIAHEDE